MKTNRILSTLAIGYFMVGFLFAGGFALYYKWPVISFLSPGFYMVILSWPYQAIGFVNDLLNYGFAGKPI